MAHPFAGSREYKASRSRVGHIMKSGGQPHSDVKADKKLFKELMAKHEASELHAEGKKSGGRLDKYARGGRARKKHDTQVNIAIVAPHGKDQSSPDATAMPGGPPLPPMAPPARPPIPAGGPGGLPPGLPPGGPPGLPMKPPGMMRTGGRIKKYASGGKTYTGGSETGIGRLQKVKSYGRKAKKK